MPAPRIPDLASLTALARLFELRTVSRWVSLGLLVGVISGLLAAGFYVAMDWVRTMLLVRLAHVHVLEPHGEYSIFSHGIAGGSPRAWLLVLLPALGGLVSGLIIRIAGVSKTEQGTEALIHAFHKTRGKIPLKQPLARAFASIIMIGSGGSVGREGPVAFLCSGVGSWLAGILRLSSRERRLLILAGAAGGIGAIFRTPLGAALFVVEVLYRDDFEVEGLVPTVLSSVVAYSVFTLIFGKSANMFEVGHYSFSPTQLPFYLMMAGGAALVGVLYIRAMQLGRVVFARVPLPDWSLPMLGGLLVGVLGLFAPQALGAGYGWLQEALVPSASPRLPVGWVGAGLLLGIAALKIVTTSVSIGSGGSGGVFGPTVVIGGMLGGAFGLACNQLAPSVVQSPGAFVIVGMACFVGGVVRAPISTLVMASEMTGSYELLVPIMLAEVVTFALMDRFTLYEPQVAARRDSGAHAGEYVLDVLEEMRVGDVVTPCESIETAEPTDSLEGLLRRASECQAQTVFPVVDGEGQVGGVITLDMLRRYFFDEDIGHFAIAADFAEPYVSLSLEDTLSAALECFASSQYSQLPVRTADDENHIVGFLGYDDVLRAYNRELVSRRVAEDPVSRVDNSLD